MRLRRIEDRSVTLCLDEGLLGRRWLVLRHLSILLCNMTFVVECPRMMLRFKGRRVCSYYAVCCGDAQECICTLESCFYVWCHVLSLSPWRYLLLDVAQSASTTRGRLRKFTQRRETRSTGIATAHTDARPLAVPCRCTSGCAIRRRHHHANFRSWRVVRAQSRVSFTLMLRLGIWYVNVETS